MRGRPKRKRLISFMPEINYFKPAGMPLKNLEQEILSLDELEAIRLIEMENLEQEAAARKMKISRITLQRILHQAHKKIARAFIYGRAIKFEGGEIMTNQASDNRQFSAGSSRRIWGQNVGRGQGLGGSDICICPKCQKEFPHQHGIPCAQRECPKCKVALRGRFCK